MSGLRGTRGLFFQHTLKKRWNSTEATPRPMPKTDDAGSDFRPWVYLGSRAVLYLVIPAVGAYAVLFWDFGDHEHVFQPARRWAARSVNKFFSLSSEENRVQFKDDAPQAEETTAST